MHFYQKYLPYLKKFFTADILHFLDSKNAILLANIVREEKYFF